VGRRVERGGEGTKVGGGDGVGEGEKEFGETRGGRGEGGRGREG